MADSKRYPADLPTVITSEEAEECIDIAEKLRKHILGTDE